MQWGGHSGLQAGLGSCRSTSNGRDCGPATPSGSTSLHHVLPPRPSQRASLAPSTTPPPAHPPPPPTPPPPPSHSSSSPHHHCQVAICHFSSPHHSRHHHWFMCSNHALLGCSNHALSGCSELQRHFVGFQLTSKVNLQITQCVVNFGKPSVYNPRVSAQTAHKLSGVSVRISILLYI